MADAASSAALNATGRLLVAFVEGCSPAEQAAARCAMERLQPRPGSFRGNGAAGSAATCDVRDAQLSPPSAADPTPCIAHSAGGMISSQLRDACRLGAPPPGADGGDGGGVTLLLTDFSDTGHFFVSRRVPRGAPLQAAAEALVADWRSGAAEKGVAMLGSRSGGGASGGRCGPALVSAAAATAAAALAAAAAAAAVACVSRPLF